MLLFNLFSLPHLKTKRATAINCIVISNRSFAVFFSEFKNVYALIESANAIDRLI